MSNAMSEEPDEANNLSLESDPEEPTEQPVEQANVCSFAFDHIYAITPDNVGQRGRTLLLSESQQCEIRSNQLIAQQAQLEVGTLRVTLDGSQTEVQKLKSLISAHLDLIQKQSEIITLNERTVKKYAAENEQLKDRLDRLGAGIQEQQDPLLSLSDSLLSSEIPQVQDIYATFAFSDSETFALPFQDALISDMPSTSGYVYPNAVDPLAVGQLTIGCKSVDHLLNQAPAAPGCFASMPQASGGQIYGNSAPPAQQPAYALYGEPGSPHIFQNTMTANTPVNLDVTLGGVQYGFNGQPKQSKGGKIKSSSSKKMPVKKNAPLTFKPANAYVRECNLTPAATSRKKTAESAYIKKNYGMDNTTVLEPPNTFRKIETSCRDFSYGETISNLGSNILSSIERATHAGCSSPFSLWQTSDEEAMYKNLEDTSCIKPLPPNNNDHPLEFEINNTILLSTPNQEALVPKSHGKGKGKKSKKVVQQERQVEIESRAETTANLIIRGMFLADEDPAPPADLPPLIMGTESGHPNDYEEILPPVITEVLPPKIEEPPKRATSPSASVYSFEDSQDTKVGERKLNEPRLSVTESLNRMGKRRSRAFGVFAGSSQAETATVPIDNTVKRGPCYMDPARLIEPSRALEPMRVITEPTRIIDPIKTVEPIRTMEPVRTTEPVRGIESASTPATTPTPAPTPGRKKKPTKKELAKSIAAAGPSGFPIEDKPVASTSKGRKRAQSTSSRVSAVSQAESASSLTGITDSKNLFKNKTLSLLSTEEPYYTPLGTPAQPEKAEPVNSLEVPKWRIRRIRPQTLYNSENEENVHDSVFHKRHGKMEIEERRIKRWDFQRLKEQLHLKKLKDRQEKLNPGGKKLLYRPYKPRRVIPQSLWQTNDNALAIEVTTTLPVTSFGELVPSFKPRKFHLPWIPRQKGKKKSKGRRLEKKLKAKDD